MKTVFNKTMSEIIDLIDNYQPNEEVRSALKEVHFVALIGPSGIGKNAVANEVELIDARSKKVISHTTREPRRNEIDGIDYHFESINADFLDRFERNLSQGELVQAAHHLTTGDFYYSTLDSYTPGGRAILDTLPQAVEDMRQLDFGFRSEIMLVADYSDWRTRFEIQSAGWPTGTKQKRVAEAIINLNWGLNQPQAHWVINDQDKLSSTAEDVVAIMDGEEFNSTAGKNIGRLLLKSISGLHFSAK